MTSECYFNTVSNMVFHDLTDGSSLPAAASQLLGLGLKFIPTPKYTSTRDDFEASFDRLSRSIGLKAYFAAESDNDWNQSTSKLRVNSIFSPPLPPLEIDQQLHSFDSCVKNLLLKKERSPKNLSPFQAQLLATIAADDNIIIANADKGLGPTAVELPWYIKKGLKFLSNPKHYSLLAEEEAANDAKLL